MATKYHIQMQYAAWVTAAAMAAVVVLTFAHVVRDVNVYEHTLEHRANFAIRALAQAVEPGLASNDVKAVAYAVAMVLQDEEIIRLRVYNKSGTLIYDLGGDKIVNVVLVERPVGPATNVVGKVELGLSRASQAGSVLRTILLDMIIGLLVVGVFVGLSPMVSAPVRRALADLNLFVQRVAKGEPHEPVFDSDLTEVDEVGRTLNAVVKRVEEAQTHLTKAQKELKAAQKEMDEYTYVISHDLKEPLRGIEAFSKFLMDGYREKLDDNGRHYVDTIRNSTLRMQRLIGDLLKFSRLSQQKNPMTIVGLNAMLMHVRVNLQYALDQKKAELRVDRLPTLHCDATAMTEVFHNLISNALKYNDKPLPVVEVGCEEKPNPDTGLMEYQFHVRDNGVGINKEYFDKIFQIFQRLQRDEEGTGIGLTIVRRVVEWHGGRIWLESTEGKGTTFYFTLPKREATMHPKTMDQPKTAPTTGGPVARPV